MHFFRTIICLVSEIFHYRRIRYQRTIHWFESMQKHAQLPTTYVIEMFHVKNPASGQKMTIELWFDSFRQDFLELMELFPSNGRIQ